MENKIVASYYVDDIIWTETGSIVITECRVDLTEDDNKWGWDAMHDNIKTLLETRVGGEIESFEIWPIDDD